MNDFLALLETHRVAHASPLSWEAYLAKRGGKARITNLDMRRVKRDGIHCVVCGDKFQKPRGNKKYCDQYCEFLAQSASNWTGLRFAAWLRDSGECVKCTAGTKTAFFHRHFISWKLGNSKRRVVKTGFIGRLSDSLGILQSKWPCRIDSVGYERNDESAEIDHILPIHKGGDPFDLLNLQTLCGKCHRSKTGRDLSGPRKKKADLAKKSEFRPGTYSKLTDFFALTK